MPRFLALILAVILAAGLTLVAAAALAPHLPGGWGTLGVIALSCALGLRLWGRNR